ncbi:type I-C CRISPR-associated protein Cas8c/Csd1 [Nitrosomonas sp.]|uniref:type I-C CRISPR-associated protein Cas8c/Csd1 n=1 Tax=Nitrosomonas sp. TaxID=42353 RepID=UPI0025D50E98|nr:type I-C CRISPR-associated protein Cas8c/Csd1 [Nitrosomonas sp.]MBV6446440.1 hypothetical protein [Nitrosomonas sp.]
MILQALKGYYDRKAQDPDGGIAPQGFEWKEIPFIIVLDDKGNLVQIEDTRTVTGKKKRAKSFLVPQGEKRTSGVKAYRLWDNAEYVFGLDGGETKQKAFIARLAQYLELDDVGLSAMKSFLSDNPAVKAGTKHEWAEISETKPWLAFRLIGNTELICQRPAVVKALTEELEKVDNRKPMVCLITGESAPAIRLQPPIKGVKDANTTGADIVSFNLRAFESYGKDQRQGENAPISDAAAFAYTTAINHLLRKDSGQKLQIGDASTVFWSEAPDDLENNFFDIFTESPKDDPDRNTRAVESLYRSVQTGGFATDNDTTRFFVLGLAPNAARISIRFWQVGTVAELSGRIRQHFDALEIARPGYEKRYLSLFRLLVNTASLGKSENIPPNLAGDTMRAILSGSPYPATLLQAAVRRIRAEQEINYPRAALIKACINRSSEKEELKVSLDENNTNPAYRLGRLFAVLEHIQERASPNINATIRDRYYGAASATPVTVFSTLLKLKNHHIAKLNKGEAVNQEKLIGAIMNDGFDGALGFPPTLSLPDQGRFAIGYYHQRQSFFTKSSDSTNKGA